MKIAIIGTGNMGSALAKRLIAAGHEVVLTARNLDKAHKLARALGERARATSIEEVASGADLVIAATPFTEQATALRSISRIAGMPVIEISNPVTPDFTDLAVGHTTSAAEEIAKSVPSAKIVKAFNTVFAQVLAEGGDFGGGRRVPVFFAGDDDDAKRKVQTVIDSIGFEAIDAGPLENARYLEPIGMMNIYLGYKAKLGTGIAPTWLRRG